MQLYVPDRSLRTSIEYMFQTFLFCNQISHRGAHVIMGAMFFFPTYLRMSWNCKAKGFVKQMMTVDPVERINIHQVGGGRWVMGHHRSILLSTLARVNLPQTLDLYLGSWFLSGICTGHLVSCISMLDLTWVQLMAVEDSFRAGQWDWRWLKQGTDSMILLLFLVNEICWDFLPLWKILEALDHPWFKIARSATVTRPLLGLGWCWHWDHFGLVMIKIQSDWMSSLMSFFSLYLCCRENAVGHTTYDMFLTIFDISINSLWYVCGKNTLQDVGQLWHQHSDLIIFSEQDWHESSYASQQKYP